MSVLPLYLTTGHDIIPDFASVALLQVLKEHPHPMAMGVCTLELVGTTHSSLSSILTWREGKVMTCSAYTVLGDFRRSGKHLQTVGGAQYLKDLLTVHIAFIPAYLTATKSKLRILQSLEMGAVKDSSVSVKCKLPWWQNCCCPV